MHSHHRMDSGSLEAYRLLRPAVLRQRIADILALGITRTARELSVMLNAPLVSVRSRLSVGCEYSDEGPALFRKAVRVEEEGSRARVWAYGLAEVPEVVAS